jgi:GxxExxY protein
MTKKEITQLSYAITGCAIKVHKALGPGLLESIYEKCLKYELEKQGYNVEQQLQVSISYEEIEFDCALKVDLLVNKVIVIELKTVEAILPIHEAQIITYMNLLKCPQGLLINFNTTNITYSLKPFINKHYRFLD